MQIFKLYCRGCGWNFEFEMGNDTDIRQKKK